MSSHMLKSARLIGALTLVSRLLGLVRDVLLASVFGFGNVASAFGMAFQLPNLFRRLFGEGALSAASIPVLTETLTKEGQPATDALAGRVMGLLLLVLAGLCVVGELVIAGLYLWYGGQSDNAVALSLSALMLPYMIFICAAAMLGGVQNVFGRFASAAAAPIILNLFMIAGLWMAPHLTRSLHREAVIVSASVVISGVFQTAWQWWAARRIGLRLPLSWVTRDPAIRRIAITMLPMILGLAAVQINTLMDSFIAWWFVPRAFIPGREGLQRIGPDILNYAQRLYQFPLGVFATALATAIFPALARHAAEKDLAGLGRTLSRGLRVASFEGIPSMIGLILIREPLVRLLFHHGAFSKWDQAVPRVSFALFMFSLGIWAFCINQIVVRAFYAMGDAKTPLWIAVRNVALNLVLNLILVRVSWLRESGLALATSFCAMVQNIALLHRFAQRVPHVEWAATGLSILRTSLATVVMGLAVALTRSYLHASPTLVQVAALVGVGAATFLIAAWLFRCEEIREMVRR